MRPPPILAALLVAIAALCGTHAAEALQPLGCVSAHIGKWHMRGDPGEHGYALHDGDTSNTPGNTIADEAKQRTPSDPRAFGGLGAEGMNRSEAEIDSRSLRSQDSQRPSASLRLDSNPPPTDRGEAKRQPEGWSQATSKSKF